MLLTTLTSYDACVKNFGEKRMVPVIVDLLEHSDIRVRRLVARTFANFAYFPQYRDFIVRDGT